MKLTMKLVKLSLFVIALTFAGVAQAQQDIAASWLTTFGGMQRVITIEKSGIGYTGTLTSPDRPAPIPFDSIAFLNGKLLLRASSMKFVMIGVASPKLDEVKGMYAIDKAKDSISLHRAANWLGTLTVPVDRKVSFKIPTDIPEFAGSLTIPDPKTPNAPLQGVRSKDGAVYMTIPALKGTFQGKQSGKELAGILSINGIAKAMIFNQDAEGNFTSITRGDSDRVRVVVRLSSNGKGGFLGSLIEPDRSQAEVMINQISLKGNDVTINIPDIKATYTGKIASTGTSLDGEIVQNGVKRTLNFQKVTANSWLKKK